MSELTKVRPNIFDTIVIGAGPAGMTAAIYGSRRKMTVLLITGPKIGGQLKSSSDIQNWTGVPVSTGPDLTNKFFDHVERVKADTEHFDLWVEEQQSVTEVTEKNEIFTIKTDTGNIFSSKTVVVTSGKVPRTLGIPGEDIARKGNGLSFCATCDAPLYKDKKMAIIGGGNSAMDVAIQLSKYTDSITIFTNIDKLIGECVLMQKIEKHPNISVEYNVRAEEILLDKNSKVRGILYEQEQEKKEFECEGIFEEVGQIPSTSFIDGFLELNQWNEIPTNRRCETEKPGVFAAGDCTSQPHKQVVVAAGEGAIAVLEAHEYLLRKEG